ncbi:MAG: AAA family ATPase [Deltaproteobacteria bacterium]|nr:AAA family ATPase [Deltaproteobacteria bacterium]
MPAIRHLIIRNFRAIKEFMWYPNPGLNCLIGPGDSGKSTVLDAIDVVLGARRSITFNDADFNCGNISQPIEILATIGALEDELQNFEYYGNVLRGFNLQDRTIFDEPQHGLETVLTVRLRVGADLEPDWTLFSERSDTAGQEYRLKWKHRIIVSPNRLGVMSYNHLTWGSGSVLPRLSTDGIETGETLAAVSRIARSAFPSPVPPNIQETINKVQSVADDMAVAAHGVKAALDPKAVALSNGAISLHDNNGTPLRQLGTGSTRLLVSGLQKLASESSMLLVDEAEYGLEPFRISKFLHELGAKNVHSGKQVFITTHSPHVLRELQVHQLHVLRKAEVPFEPPWSQYSHWAYTANANDSQAQATLRACAEAFFSKKVIVAEGKTEIGLVRGIDMFEESQNRQSLLSNGAFCADGGGSKLFERAMVFAQFGYPTAIFKDSDISTQHTNSTALATKQGIQIIEWGHGWATEEALFNCCPESLILELLDLAVDRNSADAIDTHIRNSSNHSYDLNKCKASFEEPMRGCLASSAKKYGWYKDIEPAEYIALNVIGPNRNTFKKELIAVIDSLFQWAKS